MIHAGPTLASHAKSGIQVGDVSCRVFLRKRQRVEERQRPFASATPVELAEKDIQFLTTLAERPASARSSTPRQDARASLLAAVEGLRPAQELPSLEDAASSSTVDVQFRSGRVQSGTWSGTEVLLKVYPAATGESTDLLIKNEVAAHTSLQQLFLGTKVPGSERISHLLGFLTRETGEQVLVFRKDATISSEEFCMAVAKELQAVFDGGTPAESTREALDSRKQLMKAAMVQILEGMAFMHRRERTHQKLEPRSVLMAPPPGGRPELLAVQLADLALSADVSDAALLGGATLAELWGGEKQRDDSLKALADPLRERARMAGAESPREQKLFAVSEDILSAGLLVAYLAFAPFCQPGSIDFAAIQRLLGVTFQAEMGAAREYCEADERWRRAVAFLDEDIGSGWDLLQSMLFPDYKLRPTAESCLNHPFLRPR